MTIPPNIFSGRVFDDLLYCVELQRTRDASVTHHYRRWPTLSLYFDRTLVRRASEGWAQVQVFEPGDMALYPYGVPEQVNWMGDVHALHLLFSPKLLAKGEALSHAHQVMRLEKFHNPFLAEALTELAYLGLLNTEQTRGEARTIIFAAVDHVAAHYIAPEREAVPKIGTMLLDQVVDQMHDHYAAEHTVQSLAQMTGLSARRFGANFSRMMGKTAHQYLMKSRLSMAKFQVWCGEADLTDIAHGAGFYDQAHFNRIFKADTGVTPGTYRRQAG